MSKLKIFKETVLYYDEVIHNGKFLMAGSTYVGWFKGSADRVNPCYNYEEVDIFGDGEDREWVKVKYVSGNEEWYLKESIEFV